MSDEKKNLNQKLQEKLLAKIDELEAAEQAEQAEQSDEQTARLDDEPSQRQRQESPARRVAEGAMMVALSVILGVLATYMPIFNVFLLVIWPIPVAYLIKKYGFAWGFLAFVLSGLLLSLFVGIVNSVFVILNMGAVGLWYGFAMRRGYRPVKVLLVGVVLAAISVTAVTLLSLWVMDLPLSNLSEQIGAYVGQAVQVYEEAGLLSTLAGGMTVVEFTTYMTDMMMSLIPAVFVISAMFEALLAYVLTGVIFRRLGFDIPQLPKFRDWHLSWVTLWGLIIALASYIGYNTLGYEWMRTLAMNVLYIYLPILAVNGFAILVYFAKRNNSSFLIPLTVILLVVLMQYALWVLLMLGLFDSVIDIRAFLRKVDGFREQTASRNNIDRFFDDPKYGSPESDEQAADEQADDEAAERPALPMGQEGENEPEPLSEEQAAEQADRQSEDRPL